MKIPRLLYQYELSVVFTIEAIKPGLSDSVYIHPTGGVAFPRCGEVGVGHVFI